MMKWTRTSTGHYLSGDYELIPVGLRRRREGWAIVCRGTGIDTRNKLARAKARAERHRTASADNAHHATDPDHKV